MWLSVSMMVRAASFFSYLIKQLFQLRSEKAFYNFVFNFICTFLIGLGRDESKLTEEQKREKLKLVVKPHDNSEPCLYSYK